MTLITRLSATFTDATLPVLRKDPVLPTSSQTGAGDRVLYDFKNVGTWPSQSANISASDTFFSIADKTVAGIGDGLVASVAATYDSSTGRISTSSTSGLRLEENYDDIFSDPTADYVVSVWLSYDATGAYQVPLEKGVTLNSNTANKSFMLIYSATGTSGTQMAWHHPRAGDANSQANKLVFPSATLGTVNRYGVHWTKQSGSWQIRAVFNNNTPGNYVNMSHGTDANGIQLNSAWKLQTVAYTMNDFARLYVENLTVSGRTAEQVWDADWARGNGRFS